MRNLAPRLCTPGYVVRDHHYVREQVPLVDSNTNGNPSANSPLTMITLTKPIERKELGTERCRFMQRRWASPDCISMRFAQELPKRVLNQGKQPFVTRV